MTTLERLSRWYESQCDGTWEHAHGIKIDTLDNPGWSVSINLAGTPLGDRPFAPVRDQYEHDREWLQCSKAGQTFQIDCGPGRLEDGLKIFLEWSGVLS